MGTEKEIEIWFGRGGLSTILATPDEDHAPYADLARKFGDVVSYDGGASTYLTRYSKIVARSYPGMIFISRRSKGNQNSMKLQKIYGG